MVQTCPALLIGTPCGFDRTSGFWSAPPLHVVLHTSASGDPFVLRAVTSKLPFLPSLRSLLQDALDAALRMSLSIPLTDLLAFRKVAKVGTWLAMPYC